MVSPALAGLFLFYLLPLVFIMWLVVKQMPGARKNLLISIFTYLYPALGVSMDGLR
jgi:hypothetical protein